MKAKFIKYTVPFVGIGKTKDLASTVSLCESLENTKAKLHLKYENTLPIDPNLYSNTEAVIFVTPPKHFKLPSITPMERFQIDDSDFQISPEELRNAPYEFPDSTTALITKNTPLCTDYTELKGVNNDLYVIGQLKGLGKKRTTYKCEYFSLTYWHSSSYFGHIMKSRPGVMVQCHNTNLFNSKTPIKGMVPTILQNRTHPFKFAVYRTKMKKILRRKFLNAFMENESLKQNYAGFFRFLCYLYPESKLDLEDFEKHLVNALKRVSELDLKELEKESDHINSKIPWYDVNKILSRNNITDFGITRQLPKKQKRKI